MPPRGGPKASSRQSLSCLWMARGRGEHAPSELLCTGPQVCTPDQGGHGRRKLGPGVLTSWQLGPRSSWLVPRAAAQGGAGGGLGHPGRPAGTIVLGRKCSGSGLCRAVPVPVFTNIPFGASTLQ